MMMRLIAIALTAGSLAAQTGFEAVSIRPADPAARGRTIHGGPGSSDPGLVTMRNVDLFSLVALAWGLHRYELSAPDWLDSTYFDLSARIPKGIDADQYRRMLQTMVAGRFHLRVHHESRELRTYDLAVAKSGLKIRPSTIPSTPVDGLQPPPKTPPRAFHGAVTVNLTATSMPRFADFLSGFLDTPVNDATGLQGEYEIHLRALIGPPSPLGDAENALPALSDALTEQLGLRLTPSKTRVEVLVVDRMDKSPTEN